MACLARLVCRVLHRVLGQGRLVFCTAAVARRQCSCPNVRCPYVRARVLTANNTDSDQHRGRTWPATTGNPREWRNNLLLQRDGEGLAHEPALVDCNGGAGRELP